MSESSQENRTIRGAIIRGIGSFYYVRSADGTVYTVRAKKKFRHQGISPMVGDEVDILPGEGEEHGWLEAILPRTSQCIRPPVANISLLWIVICPEPAPDMLLVDRLLIQARRQNVRCALIVNKCDLDPALPDRVREEYRDADVQVYAVSSVTGDGLETIRNAMHGELSCIAGQSGVGKSTLLNTLFGIGAETGEISEKIRRGRNTTRRAEMFVLGDIRVLDTAGFSLLEMEEVMDPVLLKDAYPEFAALEGQCRFLGCLHDQEPGCCVTEKMRCGEIAQQRVLRYRQILSDVRNTWKTRYQ